MKNRHVIITGGTGGLGSQVTLRAHSEGAHITLPYYAEKEVERLRQIMGEKNQERIDFVAADLRNEESVKALFDSLGKVEVLLHLVGGFAMGATDQFSLEDWKKQIDLNLTTTFLVCKYALRKMQQIGYGRIVTVSSRAAVEPGGQMAAYSASKAAVLSFTKSIADEMKGTEITANTVLPSVIDTPANRQAMGEKDIHKWVKPESLAEVICFLGSEAARDLRGAAVPVFGNV